MGLIWDIISKNSMKRVNFMPSKESMPSVTEIHLWKFIREYAITVQASEWIKKTFLMTA